MKLLFFFLSCLVCLVVVALPVTVQAAPAALFISLSIDLDSTCSWMVDNWAVLALILSEIAGLLPGKARGFLSGFVVLGSAIFKKKK